MLEKIMKKYGITTEELLNSIKVGIYVTDGKGTTVTLNEECCKTGGMTKREVVGKNMSELMQLGYVTESGSFKVMKSGKEETFIQDLGDGGKLFITETPIYKNDEIALIVTTERNISETQQLEKILDDNQKEIAQYKEMLDALCRKNLFNGEIVSRSVLMEQVLRQAERLGKIDANVLITGESGTGKEVIADYICKNGSRSDATVIKVNCATIPESLIEAELFGYEKGAFTGAETNGKMGLFEAANGGTIFLDEIGELPFPMQAKLLRVLQEKEIRRIGSNEVKKIDVKVIAATNVDLKEAVRTGKFREDLYYRLNVANIEVPPLRARKEDIEPLAILFMQKMNDKYDLKKTMTSAAMDVIKLYDWPGNVRELQNVIERTVINYDGDEITKFQMNRQLNGSPMKEYEDGGKSLKEIMEAYEKKVLEEYKRKYKSGNEIAQALNVDKATISRKMAKYEI